MNNEPDAFECPDQDDFYERIERVDGPPIHGFEPTLQELIQLVKFHTEDLVQLHWSAFFDGQEASEAEADAIWTRLENIRSLIRPDDFTRTVEVACIQFGMEFDARIWTVFVHGDYQLRRTAALEIQEKVYDRRRGFSRKLSLQIVRLRKGRQQEVPPELLQRMAQPIVRWDAEQGRLIQ